MCSCRCFFSDSPSFAREAAEKANCFPKSPFFLFISSPLGFGCCRADLPWAGALPDPGFNSNLGQKSLCWCKPDILAFQPVFSPDAESRVETLTVNIYSPLSSAYRVLAPLESSLARQKWDPGLKWQLHHLSFIIFSCRKVLFWFIKFISGGCIRR